MSFLAAVECQPLQGLDKSIKLFPERCTNGKNYFGEECSAQCAPGYKLAADSAKKIKCSANGFVTVGGDKLECKRKLTNDLCFIFHNGLHQLS